MDVENLNVVMARAVSLIAEVAGGDILSEVIDKYVENLKSRNNTKFRKIK